MELLESQHSVNLREEMDELRAVITRNPKEALELVNTLVEKCECSQDLKLKAEVYHLKGLIFHNTAQFNDAREWYTKSLNLRQQCNDRKGEAISLNNIGLVLHDSNQQQEALTFFEKSLVIKKELNDYKGITATYENMGVAYEKMGDYKKAIEIYYQSLKISEQHGDTNRMATTYQNIGVIHFLQEDAEYALTMFKKALELIKNTGEKLQIIQLSNNIGAMLKQLLKYEEAVAYFKQCLQMSKENNYTAGMSAADNNLGEIYRDQGNYPEALAAYYDCYHLAVNSANTADQITAAMNVSEIYLAQNNSEDAEKYLKEALALSITIQDIQKQKQINLLLSQLFESKKDTNSALEYFKNYDQLKSQVLNAENSKVVNELKTKYEVEKAEKENEINRLRNIELKDALEDLTLEKRKSEKLLLNILPEEIAYELKRTGKVKPQLFDSASVLFTDIKNFTTHSERLSPDELVSLLDFYFQSFDDIIVRHHVEKIKTIGDAYLCVSGVPKVNPEHAVSMARTALEMRNWTVAENARRLSANQPFFEFRFGIHSGPVIAGIVGKTKFEYDVWGDTVNTAARMEQSGDAGKINISGGTYDLVKHKFNCLPRGKIEAKNKGSVDMYFVENEIPA